MQQQLYVREFLSDTSWLLILELHKQWAVAECHNQTCQAGILPSHYCNSSCSHAIQQITDWSSWQARQQMLNTKGTSSVEPSNHALGRPLPEQGRPLPVARLIPVPTPLPGDSVEYCPRQSVTRGLFLSCQSNSEMPPRKPAHSLYRHSDLLP